MGTYAPPVSTLLTLGRPEDKEDRADYKPYGIGPGHIPELIRLMQDEEFDHLDEPEVYAPIHAWRALGQLRAEAAIEPMLDVIATNAAKDEDWSDWVIEEVPVMLALIGPVAIHATVRRLERRQPGEKVVSDYTHVLEAVAKRHPEVRQEVIGHITDVLETAATNDAKVNGLVICNLLDLDAVEAWPAIEKAYATGNVNTFLAGKADAVKYDLGLGPKPPSRDRLTIEAFEPVDSTDEDEEEVVAQNPVAPGPTPKERAEARAKQRKAEKKKRKQRHKGK